MINISERYNFKNGEDNDSYQLFST